MRFDQRTDNAIKGQGAVPDGRAVCLTHTKIVGGSREKGNGINTGLGKKKSPRRATMENNAPVEIRTPDPLIRSQML